jgi:hypothetical protein
MLWQCHENLLAIYIYIIIFNNLFTSMAFNSPHFNTHSTSFFYEGFQHSSEPRGINGPHFSLSVFGGANGNGALFYHYGTKPSQSPHHAWWSQERIFRNSRARQLQLQQLTQPKRAVPQRFPRTFNLGDAEDGSLLTVPWEEKPEKGRRRLRS